MKKTFLSAIVAATLLTGTQAQAAGVFGQGNTGLTEGEAVAIGAAVVTAIAIIAGDNDNDDGVAAATTTTGN